MLRLRRGIVGVCAKCGGKGWKVVAGIDESLDLPNTKRCSCHKRLERLLDYVEACLPEEFWNAGAVVRKSKQSDLSDVKSYIRKLKRAFETGFGLLLIGPNESGKTTAAAAILTHARRLGYSIAYATFDDIMKASNAFDDDDAAEWLDRIASSDFVVIDELGKEISAREHRAHAIIEHHLRVRWSSKRPTIVCSNLTVKQIKDKYDKQGANVTTVLVGRSRTIMMEAHSYRRKKRDEVEKELFG